MTTEWYIHTGQDRLELDKGNAGEVTFTVTNNGSDPDRVVLAASGGPGVEDSWLTVVQPPQPLVPAGTSVTGQVKIAVPAGTPVAEYWLQGRAYSANDPAPETNSRLSNRVTFAPAALAKPRRALWPYAVAAVLLLVVLGTVGWLFFGGSGTAAAGDDQAKQPWWRRIPIIAPHTSKSPSPKISPFVVPNPPAKPIKSDSFTLREKEYIDFDNGKQGKTTDQFGISVPTGDLAMTEDLSGLLGKLEAQRKATTAYVGVVDKPNLGTCSKVKGDTKPLWTDAVKKGGVVCVFTNNGQTAVVTIVSVDVGQQFGAPMKVRLKYDLYAKT